MWLLLLFITGYEWREAEAFDCAILFYVFCCNTNYVSTVWLVSLLVLFVLSYLPLMILLLSYLFKPKSISATSLYICGTWLSIILCKFTFSFYYYYYSLLNLFVLMLPVLLLSALVKLCVELIERTLLELLLLLSLSLPVVTTPKSLDLSLNLWGVLVYKSFYLNLSP